MCKDKRPSLEPYMGQDGVNRVRRTLAQNTSVSADDTILNELMASGEPCSFAKGENFIINGADDNDVYFLLSGDVEIILPNKRRARRQTPNQVGELAAMEPGQKRSATVRAGATGIVAWKVDGNTMSQIFLTMPEFKERMGVEMRRRQRELAANAPSLMEVNLLVWTGISLVAAALFGFAAWFAMGVEDVAPIMRALITATAALCAFLFVLSRNPAFFWRSTIGTLLFLPVLYFFQHTVSIEVDDGSGLRILKFSTESAELQPWVVITVIIAWIVALLACFSMEYRRMQNS